MLCRLTIIRTDPHEMRGSGSLPLQPAFGLSAEGGLYPIVFQFLLPVQRHAGVYPPIVALTVSLRGALSPSVWTQRSMFEEGAIPPRVLVLWLRTFQRRDGRLCHIFLTGPNLFPPVPRTNGSR